MSKFRKKPIEIEAFLWTRGPDQTEYPVWIVDAIKAKTVRIDRDKSDPLRLLLLIRTLEGTMEADVGDWIIRGVEGEIYPCKPSVFEKTYERVE